MASNIIKSHCMKYELLLHAMDANDIIHINGPPCVGKTRLAKTALEAKENHIYAHVDCHDVATPSQLYVDVYTKLQCKLKTRTLRKKTINKMMSIQDFVGLYEEMNGDAMEKGVRKLYLVLDNVDCLKRTVMMDAIVALTHVRHLYFILISETPAFDFLDYIKSPAARLRIQDRINEIQLPPWTKDDIIEAIIEDEPICHEDLYYRFVHNVVSIFYAHHTRDFNELKLYCQENFAKFLNVYRNHVRNLIIKHNRISEDMEISDSDIEEYELPQTSLTSIIGSFLECLAGDIKPKELHASDLCESAKQICLCQATLIVAMYVASYTKASDDKRNFVKYQRRSANRRSTVHSREIEAIAKPFTFERLLHIYQRMLLLIRGRSDFDDLCSSDYQDDMLSDISFLEGRNIIQMVGGDGIDSQTRYKISNHINRDYVNRLAIQVGLSLDTIYGIS